MLNTQRAHRRYQQINAKERETHLSWWTSGAPVSLPALWRMTSLWNLWTKPISFFSPHLIACSRQLLIPEVVWPNATLSVLRPGLTLKGGAVSSLWQHLDCGTCLLSPPPSSPPLQFICPNCILVSKTHFYSVALKTVWYVPVSCFIFSGFVFACLPWICTALWPTLVVF